MAERTGLGQLCSGASARRTQITYWSNSQTCWRTGTSNWIYSLVSPLLPSVPATTLRPAHILETRTSSCDSPRATSPLCCRTRCARSSTSRTLMSVTVRAAPGSPFITYAIMSVRLSRSPHPCHRLRTTRRSFASRGSGTWAATRYPATSVTLTLDQALQLSVSISGNAGMATNAVRYSPSLISFWNRHTRW